MYGPGVVSAQGTAPRLASGGCVSVWVWVALCHLDIGL